MTKQTELTDFNFFTGEFNGKDVVHYKKLYKDIKHLYKNTSNISDDTCMYEVSSLNANKDYSLLWGITTLNPVLVNKEYNMTRGHFHVDRNEPEIYIGISGSGLLMLMNEVGQMSFEKVTKGSFHYIKGTLAHRLINTGKSKLKVAASWRTNAGHDYKSIENKNFSIRLFDDNGKVQYIDDKTGEKLEHWND